MRALPVRKRSGRSPNRNHLDVTDPHRLPTQNVRSASKVTMCPSSMHRSNLAESVRDNSFRHAEVASGRKTWGRSASPGDETKDRPRRFTVWLGVSLVNRCRHSMDRICLPKPVGGASDLTSRRGLIDRHAKRYDGQPAFARKSL